MVLENNRIVCRYPSRLFVAVQFHADRKPFNALPPTFCLIRLIVVHAYLVVSSCRLSFSYQGDHLPIHLHPALHLGMEIGNIPELVACTVLASIIATMNIIV